MHSQAVLFDADDLVDQIESFSQDQLDHLPFGVILIDCEGTVLFYSETEARQSGYGRNPIGQNLFAIAACFDVDDFRGRIERAMEEGNVDLEFGWVGDYADPDRDLRIRVMSAKSRAGIWIFVQRDIDNGGNQSG